MANAASGLRRLAERALPRTAITWKDAAAAAALALVYWGAAEASLSLALVERNITPLWPPSGIALVALLRFGRRLWPGVALAAFLVNLPISASPVAAAATAAGNTLAPVLAATLLLAVGFRTRIDRPRDVVSLVGLAALLSMAVSATIGSGTLVVSGAVAERDFGAAWSVWWAGDAMGVLVFAPFLFLLATRGNIRPRPRRLVRLAEAAALFAVLAAVSAFAVTATVSMLFLTLPVVGWAAWRFQQPGAAPAVIVVSVAATWSAVADRGPFADAALFDKMLMLQSFNATVAFTAFFLAALVGERARSREALERGAADLELRVRQRTAQLSTANDRLGREVAERREAEDRLRRSERQLAEAQVVARLGTWEWDLETGEVTWSDEMFRIHGAEPGSFPVTFEKAVELVPPEDRRRIRQNVDAALEHRRQNVPDIEYRIVLPDGQTRYLYGKARLSLGSDGTPLRMLGIVQDVTERHAFEREHRIADTLQTALLPRAFSGVDGLELAARYVPAEAGFAAGGDWYDVVPVGPGSVALVIGDVAGHGLEAASLMGQLRMAVRAYALEGHPPAVVAARTDGLLRELASDQMVTMLYLLLDLDTSVARFVNAGHPPPLVVDGAQARYLPMAPGPPMGVGEHGQFQEATLRLEPGATIVLYTDGLIDRRDLAIDEGLRHLLRAADRHRSLEAERLCDRLLAEMVPGDVSDDIALLVVREIPMAADGLRMRVSAEPRVLSRVRRSLSRWLAINAVPPKVAEDIVLASSEAITNSIRHAYGPGKGWVEIEASFAAGSVELVVRDGGRWRPPRGEEGGRGLGMIRACMTEVSIERDPIGTEVRMRRRLSPVASP